MTRIPRYVLLTLVTFQLPAPVLGEDAFELDREETTHRGKPEDLQWTPHSITVIEAGQWDETPRWELEDLEGDVPGLIIDRMGSTPRGAAISLRGIASREAGAGFFPAVAVKVDDVYIGTHSSQNQVLFDLDRVEISRGPQGAFESAPAIGGSIGIHRNQPTRELDVRSEVSIADYDRKRIGAVANVPVGERFASRLSLTLQDGGDFIANRSPDIAATGRGENNEDRLSLRAAFKWQQSEDLSIRYTADVSRDDSDVPAMANISIAEDLVCNESEDVPNCSFDGNGDVPERGFLSTTQNFSNVRHYDVDQHAVHVDFKWGGRDFRSITAWRDSEEFSAYDLDASFDDLYSSITSLDYDQFTQEVKTFGEWSPKIDYAAGIFYLTNEYRRQSEDFFILPALDDAGRILDVTPDATRTIDAFQDTTLISFFAHGEYEASPQWKLDAGIRWTDVERSFDDSVSRVASGGAAPLPARLVGDVSSAEATGSIGATYRVDDEAMVYLRYSRSFRPVTFDDSANSAEGASPLGEESVDGIEIGLKSEWYDDRLRLNYVGYQNIWRDKLERVTTQVASGRVESVFQNTARVQVRGHELEVEAVPFDFLKLRAALMHQNADYQNYSIPDLAGGADPIDRSGFIPAQAPSDMFEFSGVYTRPYEDGLLRFYASYRFTKEYTSNPGIPSARIDNFTMIDVSVDYVWREWTFRLFSRNTNDKHYITNVARPLDADLASLAPTVTSTLPIVTSGQFNEPEMTGIRIIYVPSLGR